MPLIAIAWSWWEWLFFAVPQYVLCCCTPAPACDEGGNCTDSAVRTLTTTGFSAGPGCGGGSCTLDVTGVSMVFYSSGTGPTYGSCVYTIDAGGPLAPGSSAWRIECNPATGNWELLSLYYHDADPATCEVRIVLGGGNDIPTGTWDATDAAVNECTWTGTAVLA